MRACVRIVSLTLHAPHVEFTFSQLHIAPHAYDISPTACREALQGLTSFPQQIPCFTPPPGLLLIDASAGKPPSPGARIPPLIRKLKRL